MKKLLYIILFPILILQISCNDCSALKSEILRLELKNDSLIRHNENINKVLLQKINEDLEQGLADSRTQYLFVAIWYESSYDGISSKSKVYVSTIEKIEGLTEEIQYKRKDNLERELLQRYPVSVKEITKKEIFVFDTYVEASNKIQEIVR